MKCLGTNWTGPFDPPVPKEPGVWIFSVTQIMELSSAFFKAAERRQTVAHGASRGDGVRTKHKPRQGRKSQETKRPCVAKFSAAPPGLAGLASKNPWLTPWAKLLRRSAPPERPNSSLGLRTQILALLARSREAAKRAGIGNPPTGVAFGGSLPGRSGCPNWRCFATSRLRVRILRSGFARGEPDQGIDPFAAVSWVILDIVKILVLHPQQTQIDHFPIFPPCLPP